MSIKSILIDSLIDTNFFTEITKLESPCYIYHLGIMDRVIKEIRLKIKSIDNIFLYYAVKANFNSEVLCFLKERVDGFDVASTHESALLDALSIHNYTFNGPGFTLEDIKDIYQKNKSLDFNSLSQSRLSLDVISQKDFGIQVSIPYLEKNRMCESRFGINVFDREFIDFIKKHGLRIKRLHFHNGEKDSRFYEIIKDVLSGIDTSLLSDECFINLGGGIEQYLMTDSMNQLADQINGLNQLCRSRLMNCKFILEPGSALINMAGYMLSTIISTDYVKRIEKWRVVLDSSAHNLHVWYKPRILTATCRDKTYVKMDIGGSTCYENDIFFRNENYSKTVLSNTKRFVEGIRKKNNRLFSKIIYPCTEDYSYLTPYMFLKFEDHNKGSLEDYELLLDIVYHHTISLGMSYNIRNSFGFRNISSEYFNIIGTDIFVYKIAPGKLAGVRFHHYLYLINCIAGLELNEYRELRSVYKQNSWNEHARFNEK